MFRHQLGVREMPNGTYRSEDLTILSSVLDDAIASLQAEAVKPLRELDLAQVRTRIAKELFAAFADGKRDAPELSRIARAAATG
jgi:hypothetical protein